MNSILEEYIEELAEPLTDGETIILGTCFSHEGKIEKGEYLCHLYGYSKAEKISYYSNDIIFETGNSIAYAMYADDEMPNDIMQTINDALKWDVESKVDFFIPGAKKIKDIILKMIINL